MITLSTLTNTHRPSHNTRRIGRGISSGAGKTCGRGTKGQGSRSGYKKRHGREGGQFRMYMKMPIRGFSNERFRTRLNCINLQMIDKLFEDGDLVNVETLILRGCIKGVSYGVKILGNGPITKKVKIEAHAISDGAKHKLQQANIDFSIIE